MTTPSPAPQGAPEHTCCADLMEALKARMRGAVIECEACKASAPVSSVESREDETRGEICHDCGGTARVGKRVRVVNWGAKVRPDGGVPVEVEDEHWECESCGEAWYDGNQSTRLDVLVSRAVLAKLDAELSAARQRVEELTRDKGDGLCSKCRERDAQIPELAQAFMAGAEFISGETAFGASVFEAADKWAFDHRAALDAARTEELTRDKERLDWLEQSGSYVSRYNEPFEKWAVHWETHAENSNGEFYGGTAREAIDAAREAKA